MRSLPTLGLAALAAALVGCNATGAMTPEDAMPTGVAKKSGPAAHPATEAGMAVTPIAEPARLKNALAIRDSAGPARPDPFALTTAERYFETQQEEERIFGSAGGFSVQLKQTPEPTVLVVPPEPQPYRRLSGIVVGDAVLGILEEEGRPALIITPGMQIPNSPWRVLSIDQDKAVLVRSGKVLPTQVIVRLETPPPGQGPAGIGGTGTSGGASGDSGPGRPGAPGRGPGQGRGPTMDG